MSIYQDRPLVAIVTITPIDFEMRPESVMEFVLDHQANAEVIDVVMRLMERRNPVSVEATA